MSVKEERIKKLQFEKRKSTLLKGAKELSVLCDINVCVVILSPDGKLETWPENLDDVRAAFRDAAAPNKRLRSDNCRKPPGRPKNPSQVEIIVLDDQEDGEKASKKMKAAISGEIGNSVAGEGGGGGGTGVLVMGEKTEDHHHQQLALYDSDSFAAGIGNYCKNPIIGCRSSSSDGGYGGGGYSSSTTTGYEIQNLHGLNYSDDDDYASWVDPLLCVQPLQSRLGGDFQFGNHY